ncbi:MAG: RNA polymerase sigma factor [Sedimentisphaerales bacterium]|nr:RNA polymerase sigma factor [Sedimentisphaerales bacterium]
MGKTEYYPEIKKYIKRKIKSPDDVEDLTQQVFLDIYQSKNRDKNIQNHKAFLYGTARTLVADYYRRKNKQTQLVKSHKKLADKIIDEKQRNYSQAKELIEEIESIIAKMPKKAREASKLILIKNVSYEEAAQKANCPISVFYVCFHEGLKILRKKLKHKCCNDNELDKTEEMS